VEINSILAVQLQILTSALKMYLANQDMYQDSVVSLLQTTSESTDNADLRDRAFFYWRLLDANLDLAKRIILGEKPVIHIKEENLFDEDLVNSLIGNMGYVNSVYQTYIENLPLLKVKQQLWIASQERMNQLNEEIDAAQKVDTKKSKDKPKPVLKKGVEKNEEPTQNGKPSSRSKI
jgi:hypothetical protein